MLEREESSFSNPVLLLKKEMCKMNQIKQLIVQEI